jgi:hypothetical protein
MNINRYKSHSTAQQVKFWDGEDWCAGIIIGGQIVCACCGSILDLDEIWTDGREDGIDEPIVVYDTWVDFSDEISED